MATVHDPLPNGSFSDPIPASALESQNPIVRSENAKRIASIEANNRRGAEAERERLKAAKDFDKLPISVQARRLGVQESIIAGIERLENENSELWTRSAAFKSKK